MLMKFNVFNGEYPFDQLLGQVYADTPEDALATALKEYSTVDHRHPVVEPVEKADHGHASDFDSVSGTSH